jgi:hypothetical protein
MPRRAYPAAEEALDRRHRSGSSYCETGFTYPDGRYVHQVDATNGENKLRVEGATPAEAWHRAVEAAAAVGMLAVRPRPMSDG